jgi:hypothetical protein
VLVMMTPLSCAEPASMTRSSAPYRHGRSANDADASQKDLAGAQTSSGGPGSSFERLLIRGGSFRRDDIDASGKTLGAPTILSQSWGLCSQRWEVAVVGYPKSNESSCLGKLLAVGCSAAADATFERTGLTPEAGEDIENRQRR